MFLLKNTILAFLFTALFFGNAFAQNKPQITIDSITSDIQINGKIIGLTQEAMEQHKVVVFVKTDKWYIHPYAHGGDGKSWASVDSDGSWKISTVNRGFSAAFIAALVVSNESNVPAVVQDINNLQSIAEVVKKLEGTQDYGKL